MEILKKIHLIRPFYFILSIIFFLVLGYLSVTDLNLYTPDSARYLIWSNSLANFQGFTDTTYPEPSHYVIHAPLYSVLMSPIAFIFPFNTIAQKLATLMLGVLALILFSRFLSDKVNCMLMLFGCIVLTFNPLFFLFSTEILSDIPFIACLISTFLILEKFYNLDQETLLLKVGLCILVTASVLMREVGISLLISTVIYLFYRKDFKLAISVFLSAILFYLAWYFRNEVMVANSELPSLTNSKLFAYHFFSSSGSSLFNELASRFSNNLNIYAPMFGRVIFFPLYFTNQFDVVSRFTYPLANIYTILKAAEIPLSIIILIFVSYGYICEYIKSKFHIFMLLFFIFYFLIILLYPINDIRFMLPISILLLYYFLIGVFSIYQRLIQKHAYLAHFTVPIVTLLIIFLVPNILWTGQFMYNCYRYNRSPLTFENYFHDSKNIPSHFTRPYRFAGEWLLANTKPSALILSQRKELATWLNGRKLMSVDQTIPVEVFENLIRDYDIQYIVSHLDNNDITEFAVQLQLSNKYTFTLEKIFGKLQIYKVGDSNISNAPTGNPDFTRGINFIKLQRYKDSAILFDSLRLVAPQNPKILFYTGLVNSLNLQPKADSLFEILKTFPQAGIYINEIAAHRQIVELIKAANSTKNKNERAKLLFQAGAAYHHLGFRNRGLSLLESAIQNDSTYLPALVMTIYYKLKDGDKSGALNTFQRIDLKSNNDPIVMVIKNVFMRLDSLELAKDRLLKSRLLFTLSQDFGSLGFTDYAIDFLLSSINNNPKNLESYFKLAELNKSKRRFYPALKAYEMILSMAPNDISARNGCTEIARMY